MDFQVTGLVPDDLVVSFASLTDYNELHKFIDR